MLCKKCNTENLLKADYCQNCGNQFTQEEKDTAYGKTIFGIFEKTENYISYLSPVELIKGNKFFRLGVIAVIIIYSFIMLMINGNYMRIHDSNEYDVMHNKDTKAYYIVADSPYVNVDLYIPKKAQNIAIHTVNDEGIVQYTDNYTINDAISLSINDDYHYIIQADFSNKSQSLEVYVMAGQI